MIVAFVLLMVVVLKFETVFKQLGSDLQLPTQFLIFSQILFKANGTFFRWYSDFSSWLEIS